MVKQRTGRSKNEGTCTYYCWRSHKLCSLISPQIEDLQGDLADGLALKTLVERLSGGSEHIQMPMGNLVQSEERQKRNLAAVLTRIEEITEAEERDIRSFY